MFSMRVFLGMLSVLFSSVLAFAGEGVICGQVSLVRDGDSIQVRSEGKRYEVRLYGIDAPEYQQRGAFISKQRLKDLLLGESVKITIVDKDRYDRLVAIVSSNGIIVNEMMIEQGMAWVYSRYCHKPVCRDWKKEERKAKLAQRGIWREKHPIPPWVWRHRKK